MCNTHTHKYIFALTTYIYVGGCALLANTLSHSNICETMAKQM